MPTPTMPLNTGKSAGVSLIELVLGIGLLGLVLLIISLFTIKTRQAGGLNRHYYEASNQAENQLELLLSESVARAPLNSPQKIEGKFSDGTVNQLEFEYYSIKAQSVAVGLGDEDVKGIRVTINWVDSIGPHTLKTESVAGKFPR